MSTLNDDDRANLTAYLDGELDEESSQALEAKLSQDPTARAEVDALRQAWTMLDYLPKPSPSASFTHRTMERLSMERPPVETGRMPARRTGSPWALVAWAAALLVAAWIGWAVSQRLGQTTPDPDEPLVRQLQLIEKWRAYELVDDLEFLRALDDPELFADDVGS